MSTPWSEPAGSMETTIALALRQVGVPGATGALVVAVRQSFWLRCREMLTDPRWKAAQSREAAERVFREYLLGGEVGDSDA